MADKNLKIEDEHFDSPLEQTSSISDREMRIKLLEELIEKYKIKAKEVIPHTPKARELIKHLVALRFKLHELRESGEGEEKEEIILMGHHFEDRIWDQTKAFCEICGRLIFGFFQSWCKCKNCGYRCHKQCLKNISRTCAFLQVQENPILIFEICPEKGLHQQNYRCFECKIPIGFGAKMEEARLCDYNGRFFCRLCHWNDLAVLPGRVVKNWDFQKYKVSRGNRSFLKLMENKPIISLETENPFLSTYHEEILQAKILREEILLMKKILMHCSVAREQKLLFKLENRQHFLENSSTYTLQDLLQLHKETLIPELEKIQQAFQHHIKVECKTCQAKGGVCCICKQEEIIYPFDKMAASCLSCEAVMHQMCSRSTNTCPSCSPQRLK